MGVVEGEVTYPPVARVWLAPKRSGELRARKQFKSSRKERACSGGSLVHHIFLLLIPPIIITIIPTMGNIVPRSPTIIIPP